MSAATGSARPAPASPLHSLAYRPEIDGLRALAVLAVVLYHAPLGVPGGYTGVDVFFVLSGFLITSLILRDLRAGRFSLVDFWERRLRRILPALSVMVLATLVAGAFFLLSDDFEDLGKSAVAQALLAANFHFWKDDATRGGYFGPDAEERPLLHTWSLAVEEQFYLLFPLALAFLFRFVRFRGAGPLSLLLFGVGVAGVFFAAHEVRTSPSAAFYLLPARAWELLCGAWIAAMPVAWSPRRRLWRETATWLGLAGILLPCWLYSKETPFPGIAALPPCLGTALVIWANARRDGQAGIPTSGGRLLALRPLVFVGLISYSLYLWHWPVLVFGKFWWRQAETPWPFRAGLLLAAGGLAVISWRFVETPFRLKQVAATRKSLFRFAGAATLATILLGAGLDLSEGLPARLPEGAAKNEAARKDRLNIHVDVEVDGLREDRLHAFGGKDAGRPVGLLLWGDSHARHALPAVEAFCAEAGISGRAAIQSSTPPVLDAAFKTIHGLKERTPEFSAAVMDYIERHDIPRVLLAARWGSYQELDAGLLEKSLAATIRALHAGGREVWILQDVPDVDAEAPKALALDSMLGRPDVSWRRTIADHRRKNAVLFRLADRGLPAMFIDPAPRLLEPGSDRYRADRDGVSIYHDDDHLTKTASREILLPLLREALATE